MEARRDTIILELIKYLVNSEKQLPKDISTAFGHQPSAATITTAHVDTSEIARYQQQTNYKLDELKRSIELLHEQLQALSKGNSNGNGHHHEPYAAAISSSASTTTDSFYQELVQGYAETAEEKLQSFLGGGLIAQNNSEFFLWSGNWKNRICIVSLQAENNAVSHQVLAVIGSEAVLSINSETEQAEDMLLQINRKITEYHLRHPSLPPKLKVGVCLIDKRQAKVFFAGARMHLVQVGEEGVAVHEGSKSFAGTASNSFSGHQTNIRRGTSFFLYGNNVSSDLDKLLKKIAEESPQDKKAQLTKWLAKKNSSDAIIGFSF
ncbi:hypothetical protein [Rhodoflexus sp.]